MTYMTKSVHLWYTSRTTNEDYVINVALCELCILQSLFDGLQGLLEQAVIELFEACACQGFREVVAFVEALRRK